MFAVRRHKKAIFALPAISLAVASLIHVGASFADKPSSPIRQAEKASSNVFSPAAGLRESAPPFGGYGVLRAKLELKDANCARPIAYTYGASIFDSKSVATFAELLRDEILPGARNTAGMGIYAFFVSTTGEIPPALAGFQRLADSIPGGIGIITQTPAGMTFAPGRETSAKLWLAVIASEVSKPDTAGMFGIVIEPPLGGCKAVK